MKMLYKSFLWGALALLASFVFSACGDDSSSGSSDDNLSEIPDSLLYSDSLYTWYLEQLAKGNSSSSEATKKDLSSESKDGSQDSSETKKTGEDDDIIVDEDDSESDSKVRLLPPAGFYSSFTIPVPESKYGGTIHCTFDGSMPTADSPEFTEPYTLTKNTPVRCIEVAGDTVARKSSHTFFIDETVSMPVVAISVDPYDMFDPKEGYYSQGVASCMEPCKEANYWKDIELPVHVEFFENGSKSAKKDWQIDAGLSITGQYSRYRGKKSVAIKMKSEYQDGRLKYALFKTRPENNKFKAFNLRNNGNRFVGDYIEDPMLTSLMEGSSVDYQRSRQVVVYYNGQFHGIYDLRERLNEHFIETNYGIDSKQVDMVKHVKDEVTASGGSADAYLALLDFIHTSNFSGENNKAYSQVATMMDVGNYADYMAAEIYIHNGDWPDNNVRAWRAPEQPFKFPIFDVDHGFGWDWTDYWNFKTQNMFRWIEEGGHNECNGERCFAEIYIKLIKNPDFRRLFINHSAVMFDYYLTYDKVVAATNAMTATIGSEEMARDQLLYPRNEHSFDATGATLISFASTQTEKVRSEYRAEFDLEDDITVTIASGDGGEVLLDEMKLPSSNYKGKFFGGNDMLLTAVPKLGKVFDAWTDGKTDNPRLVSPKDGDSFTAKFK